MAITYLVDKPHYHPRVWLAYLAKKTLLLPIIWGITKRIGNALLGAKVGKVILPAQTKDDFRDLAVPYGQHENGFSYENYRVKTFDGAILDSLRITNPNNQSGHMIVHLSDGDKAFEHYIPQLQAEAEATNADILTFNYRGVGKSTGRAKSKFDLFYDALAQIDNVFQGENLNPANLIIKGHGLGAGIAAMVAEHYHDKGKKVHFFADRAAASQTRRIVGLFRSKHDSGAHEVGYGKVIGSLIKPIVKLVLLVSRWEIHTLKNYRRLPSAHKDYLVVRSNKANRTVFTRDDSEVTHYASIHRALRSQRRQHKKHLQLNQDNLRYLQDHFPASSREPIRNANAWLDIASASLHDRKVRAVNFAGDAHHLCLSRLTTANDGSALDFFARFSQQVFSSEEAAPAGTEQSQYGTMSRI